MNDLSIKVQEEINKGNSVTIKERKDITNLLKERREIVENIKEDDMFFYKEIEDLLKLKYRSIKVYVSRKKIEPIFMNNKAILTGKQIKSLWKNP